MNATNNMDLQASESIVADCDPCEYTGVEEKEPPKEFEFVSVKEEPRDEAELPLQVPNDTFIKQEPRESKEKDQEASEQFEFVSVKEEPRNEEKLPLQLCELEINRNEEDDGDVEYILGVEPSEQWNNIILGKSPQTTRLQYRRSDVSSTQVEKPIGAEEQQHGVKTCSGIALGSKNKECDSARDSNKTFECKSVKKTTRIVRFTCDSCLAVFTTKHNIITHVFSHINGVEPPSHVCKSCGEVFQTAEMLSDHLTNNFCKSTSTSVPSKVFRHKCETCGKTFRQSGHLIQHRRVHTGEKPYSCDVCGKCFFRVSHVKVHKRVHSGERPFKCVTCGKGFTHSGHLQNHNRIHTGEHPYTCDVCKKSFSQSTHLRNHKRIHSGELPYKCESCGKCFRISGELSKHTRIHTGEKPYSCDVCGKSFTQLSHLQRHKLIHTGESPFECEICGKCFRESCRLATHRRIHTILL